MYLQNCQISKPNSLTNVTITGPCVLTGLQHKVVVSKKGLNKWLEGALIQDALPELTPSQREFLISGVSEEAWDQMYGDSDEDDNYIGEGDV